MSRGASNPLGFCSRINIFGSLEEAIKKIESLKSNLKPVGHYGTHALYLGKN